VKPDNPEQKFVEMIMKQEKRIARDK
jgi:hypothetical protein